MTYNGRRVPPLVIGVLVAVVSAACGSTRVSRREAQDLILKSEAFGKIHEASIDVYWGPDNHSVSTPAAKAAFERLGWVLPADPAHGRRSPVIAPALASRLTRNYWNYFPTGESEWPLFSGVAFDAAKRQFVAVTGITAGETEQKAVAEFQWKWELVGVAQELVRAGWSGDGRWPSPDQVNTGRAELRLFDDGWRLGSIVF